MTFDDIEEGASVYLDANVLLYHFSERSHDCARLVQRCMTQQVFGIISVQTIVELCHRSMCEEAKRNAKYLRQHPVVVQSLSRYATLLENVVSRYNFRIVAVSPETILRSQVLRQRYGLLTNDSIIAQVLFDYGIPAIATNDPDFERLDGIQVFKPSDL